MIGIFFGKIGSGKTSFLAEMVRKNEIKKKLYKIPVLRFFVGKPYEYIFSNERIEGTLPLEPRAIGLFKPPDAKCLFLIDEAGIYFNARQFKSLPKTATDFFAVSRHYDSDIVMTSQTVDIDKSLRNRANRLYEVKKGLFGRSHADLITYKIGVDENTHDLVEGYFLFPKIVYLLTPSLFGLRLRLNRKRVYKLFDTKSKGLEFQYDGYDAYLDHCSPSRAQSVLP